MKTYFRPIVQSGPDRPADALTLAGGWGWFRDVAVHQRGAAQRMIAASNIPSDALERLTTPRGPIAGLQMDAPQLMGILNVTPDSFSDGGRYLDPALAVGHAGDMIRDGATLIDIGGESTRPGADEVPAAEEIARTAPVIAGITGAADIPISIDTRKSTVAAQAVSAGAAMINDVAALSFDPDLADVVAQSGLPVCLMHAQGAPATMQTDPTYDNVLLDVYDFLEDRIAFAISKGIERDLIVVDPGIGFGKTVAHNLALLRGLSLFHGLGCPILLGASRKRFIGTIGGGRDPTDRVAGSVAVALHGLRQGVQILRVHDIFATKQAFDLEQAITGAALA
ncbi:dihydropteroate synthase [Yoonia sp. SS1-5]|uniref:Dihydropteroate synthase n=1 Tax=Yoonia rhodophyticola TaxID=3137370 RepID=A0ABZ3JCY0_9RHOB